MEVSLLKSIGETHVRLVLRTRKGLVDCCLSGSFDAVDETIDAFDCCMFEVTRDMVMLKGEDEVEEKA